MGDLDNLDARLRERILFGEGPVDRWPSGISFRPSSLEMEGALDDALCNRLALLIFSPRVVAALMELRLSDVQFLPVDVFRYDGCAIPGYAIANVVSKVDALDREQSTYDCFPDDYHDVKRRGRISAVMRPVLRGSAIKGLDAMHLVEWETAIYVSDRIRNVFVRSGFTGIGFWPVHVV